MNNEISISVVMSAYNAEEYIKEAIESILNQTFSNFEFIIINDGSTDKTLQIIKKYQKKDNRIKLISRENKGLIKSLNEGIDRAIGKYIARMDADDISLPSRFQKQFDFMEKNLDIGLSGSNAQTIGNIDTIFQYPSTYYEIINSYLIKSPFIHPTVIMRRDIIIKNKLRYNENYIHAEDYKLWFDFLKCTKVANIPVILLKYRISNTQITNKYSGEQAIVSQRIRREFIEEYVNYTITDSITINDIKHIKKELNKHHKLTKSITYCMFLSLNKYDVKALIYFLTSFDYLSYPYNMKEFIRWIIKYLKPKKYEKWL